MATNNCSPVTFFDTCKDSFYFEETKTACVLVDAFKKSPRCLPYQFQSKDNKFMVLNRDRKFDLNNLTKEQLHQPESRFLIQTFQDSDLTPRRGRPVMVYTIENDKKMVACCYDENQVRAEPMVPNNIDETVHKAIFYMTEVEGLGNAFMFESTLFKARFLGFEPVKGLLKLVLHDKLDEVDEGCQFFLTKCKP
ncbi:interleukin-18-like isoform X2 [Mugil cephalus]|uniref:interleukin-18-like isoform X2 n=1 Tax=Mugil cephalus TaxID=48193 RepID=UPI001FB68C59|nr:interleukin-18-like isoform X2 [Mugil cephalus]